MLDEFLGNIQRNATGTMYGFLQGSLEKYPAREPRNTESNNSRIPEGILVGFSWWIPEIIPGNIRADNLSGIPREIFEEISAGMCEERPVWIPDGTTRIYSEKIAGWKSFWNIL